MTIHSTDLDRTDRNIKDAQQSSSLPPLILTTGEPAGIGMDIVLQLALAGDFTSLDYPVVVLADEQALQQRFEQVYGRQIQSLDTPLWQRIAEASEVTNTVESSQHFLTEKILQAKSTGFEAESSPKFYLIHVGCNQPVIAGQLNVDNAVMVITQLQIAHKLAQSGAASAIVTGPLQKSVLIEAGITLEDGSMFTGHTEFFMQKSGCDKVVMMLANNAMKVALVTIHMPLKEVAAAITPDNVRQTVQILLNDLQQKFGLKDPRVLVCGLNPHAGEDGHLGTEEIEVINPVLKQFQDQGVNISSAMPADTLFTQRHLKHCDAVIAMYHDQGLPVLKSHGFGDTVNLTLGLPYIRTSVDHGTALDLAGKRKHEGAEASDAESGQASSSSLWQALTMANDMVKSTLGLR
ncbi:4-hydroxythreonine-4-phosphate dehydrogenase PdxA [Psychrobacter phenylpyruvicus]|uniref:4-hydroxythreonine-4-phosphate dehydrogenase n=1 Tax=Psychrobacter phenylpyruvicus TaxID=29432 RepID=A0A379LKI8_9GAMM|nr:4-hydroxythreonine-4-phosphate dehydrogenase PdxA [Psychrobacter phenylpyruvicus]SUD91129.1 4-hydroxythreonine-4-phosphate dehydrogenase [Psychrobacter phenylpyruvicus]